MLNYKTS